LGTDNAFAILGLAPGATEVEAKAAWRRLVSQWHPDRNASASAVAKMQRINQAFKEIRRSGFPDGPDLSSADGSTPARPEQARRSEDSNGADPCGDSRDTHGNGSGDDDPGASRTDGTDRHGRAINRKVKLTLEEAAAGCTKVLQGRITDACTACAGVGYQVLTGACPQCEGSGAVRERAWYGWLGTPVECTACHGGGVARQPCRACDGTGKLAARRYRINVRIPHGARDGDLLHVDGRRARPGQPSDDFNLRVEVSGHAFFKLDDDGTISCEIPVDGFAWIANRSISVPTLGGLQSMQLHRDQRSYRLRGRGFPAERRGLRGDQVVEVVPIFPEQLSTDQNILLDQLLATFSGPDGQSSDDRLRAWGRALRAWEVAHSSGRR
jgi:molecular chaperone DnaJ